MDCGAPPWRRGKRWARSAACGVATPNSRARENGLGPTILPFRFDITRFERTEQVDTSSARPPLTPLRCSHVPRHPRHRRAALPRRGAAGPGRVVGGRRRRARRRPRRPPPADPRRRAGLPPAVRRRPPGGHRRGVRRGALGAAAGAALQGREGPAGGGRGDREDPADGDPPPGPAEGRRRDRGGAAGAGSACGRGAAGGLPGRPHRRAARRVHPGAGPAPTAPAVGVHRGGGPGLRRSGRVFEARRRRRAPSGLVAEPPRPDLRRPVRRGWGGWAGRPAGRAEGAAAAGRPRCPGERGVPRPASLRRSRARPGRQQTAPRVHAQPRVHLRPRAHARRSRPVRAHSGG